MTRPVFCMPIKYSTSADHWSRVTCDVYVESFRHFADYDVLAIKSVSIDQHGEVVQTGSTALLARTGTAVPEFDKIAMYAIEFRGRITSVDLFRRKATIALDARSHGRRLFGYAAADVRFPVPD